MLQLKARPVRIDSTSAITHTRLYLAEASFVVNATCTQDLLLGLCLAWDPPGQNNSFDQSHAYYPIRDFQLLTYFIYLLIIELAALLI